MGRRAAAARTGSSRPTSSSTPLPGRTSTAPRTIHRAPPRSTSAGRRTSPSLGAPLVYYSTDYVFDGTQARAVRRVGRAEPAVRVRADEAPRRGRGGRAGVDRPLLVALRPDRQQLRPHDAAARRGAGRGRGRRRPARLADLRRPPRRRDAPGPAPAARRLPRRRRRRRDLGRLRRGDLRGGRPRARDVRRITTAELGAPGAATRPTRCCGARRARRRCRTGAKACARRSPPSGPGPSANRSAWRATRS